MSEYAARFRTTGSMARRFATSPTGTEGGRGFVVLGDRRRLAAAGSRGCARSGQAPGGARHLGTGSGTVHPGFRQTGPDRSEAAARQPGSDSNLIQEEAHASFMSIDTSRAHLPRQLFVATSGHRRLDAGTREAAGVHRPVPACRRAVPTAGVPRYVPRSCRTDRIGQPVIASLFDHLASQLKLSFRFASVGIDAWHFTNAYLLARTVDGAAMKTFKGRYDTYDVAKLERALTPSAASRISDFRCIRERPTTLSRM